MANGPTFTLRLRIMGLGLFAYRSPNMHVLMPGTKGGSHCGVDEHVARIYFDRETVDNPVLFDNCRWDLTRLKQDQALAELPEPIVSLQPHTASSLPPGHLSSAPNDAVHAQLIFGSGRWHCHGQTARFDIGTDQCVPMTNWLEWEIRDIVGDALHWRFEGLNGHTPPTLTPVVPNSDRVIELDVVYAVPGDHADRNSTGRCDDHATADHFRAYYDLLGTTHGPVPCCRPDSLGPGACQHSPVLPIEGGKVYTCMLAQSAVEPE